MKATSFFAVSAALAATASSLVIAAPASSESSSSAASLALAGQRVICSYPGQTVPQETLDAVTQGLCAGIIFFGENLNKSNPAVLQKAVYQLNSANGKGINAGVPLFLSTDQEGGLVRRLPGGPTSSAKTVGASSNVAAAARQMGTDAAAALKAYGLNLNLAPILGVYRQGGDFLDNYERSFSMNQSTVSTAATNFITAERSAGVLSSAKHFPGLGGAGTTENTDAQPVIINFSASTLRSVDMLPYQSAISTAKVEMVMPSWAQYPSLDPTYPSGLSRTILQQELRGRLGFKGVTISDAIEAGGLRNFGTHENRAVLAAQAGMDIILAAARNATQGPSIARALAAAYDSGKINQSEFQASVNRIKALRSTIQVQ